MAPVHNDDTILPSSYRNANVDGQVPYSDPATNTFNRPTPVVDSSSASQGSDDKLGLGDREKNGEGDMNIGQAPPVDEFASSTNTNEYAGHGLFGFLRRHRRVLTHAFIQCLFTGWWIASLVLHYNDKNWVVPFLLWLAITVRIITFYVPIRYVSQPIAWTWQHTAVAIQQKIPERTRTPLGALVAIAAILVGAMASDETADNTRGNRAISLLGLAVILFVFWGTSRHRSRVNWRTVIVGMLAQYIVGLFVLRTGVGYDIFKFIADRAGDLLGFARDGVAFITNPDVANLGMFFFGVIPAIICELRCFRTFTRPFTHSHQSSSLSCRLSTTLASSNGSSRSLPDSSSGL